MIKIISLHHTTSLPAIAKIYQLRQKLHKTARPSGQEEDTARVITDFFRNNIPQAKLYENVGGAGVIAEFCFSPHPTRTVVIRADLDAVPVKEVGSNQPYNHLCGHDGHMSILTLLALKLSTHPLKHGKVILLFQPAEESAAGAKNVLKDPVFQKIMHKSENPVFLALHNIPGYAKGQVIISNQKTFSSAVTSRKYQIFGKSSHAANPEQGLNPIFPIMAITNSLKTAQNKLKAAGIWHKITIVHADIGKIWNFGTSPQNGEICLTFRARNNEDLNQVITTFEDETNKIIHNTQYKLTSSIHDNFPATNNSTVIRQHLLDVCKKKGLKTDFIQSPFSWGEDFGYFLLDYPGLMFGLGSGKDNSGLHTSTYKFPDEIIPTGANVFYQMANEILG